MKVDSSFPTAGVNRDAHRRFSNSDPFPTLHVPSCGAFAAAAPDIVGLYQQVIDGLPEQIALLDEHWNILAVNDPWTKTAAQYGYSAMRPGKNYFEFIQDKAAEGYAQARPVVDGILEMAQGTQDCFHFMYPGIDQWEGHAFHLRIHRFQIAGQTYATVTRYNVTELMQLRRLREGYCRSIIEGQDEERRRIAREIHDSTMQLLAALGLNLGQLKLAHRPDRKLEIFAEMEQLLGEAQREIRSISYLAHPPLLKDLGLAEALQALAAGYAQRTGLRIVLNVDAANKVVWREAEVAIYRLVQEALSNIHRHARATDATIGIYVRRSLVHVVVVDNGIGMPRHVRLGVGIPSMRARLTELGGRLNFRDAKPGTVLVASLPLEPRISATGDLAIGA